MLKCYDIKIERVLEGFECQSDCHHACEELFQKARMYYRKKNFFHCFNWPAHSVKPQLYHIMIVIIHQL